MKADANRSVQKRAAWVLTQALGPKENSRGKWQIYLELLPLLNEYGLHLIQVGLLACPRHLEQWTVLRKGQESLQSQESGAGAWLREPEASNELAPCIAAHAGASWPLGCLQSRLSLL